MVPSFPSPTTKKLKVILDVTTNIVVVLFAVVAIGVLVKNYFAPQGIKTNVAFKKGTTFPEIAGADYTQAQRTLILALNVDCRYCSRSVPFYNSLAEARKESAGQFNIVALFINKDAALVKSYTEEKQLSVQTIAGVDRGDHRRFVLHLYSQRRIYVAERSGDGVRHKQCLRAK